MSNYLRYWQLDHPVFNRLKCGSDIFIPRLREQEKTRLWDFFRQAGTLSLLVGSQDSGKTTVARGLYGLAQTDVDMEAYYLTLAKEEPRVGWLFRLLGHLLDATNSDRKDVPEFQAVGGFGNSQASNDLLPQRVFEHLEMLHRQKKNLGIIIDCGHKSIKGEALKDLELLFEVQGIYQLPLRVLIVGLHGFEVELKSSPRLKTCISNRVEWSEWTSDESMGYIMHHLKRAGLQADVFEQNGLVELVARGCGRPGNLDRIGELSLFVAASQRSISIDENIVKKASEHLLGIVESDNSAVGRNESDAKNPHNPSFSLSDKTHKDITESMDERSRELDITGDGSGVARQMVDSKEGIDLKSKPRSKLLEAKGSNRDIIPLNSLFSQGSDVK